MELTVLVSSISLKHMQLESSQSPTKLASESGKSPKWQRFSIIALIGTAVAMLATNPSQKDYAAYAADQLASHIQENYCRGTKLPEWANGVGSFFQDVCKTAIAGGNTLIDSDRKQSFIQGLTKRQNFYLFSIYSTKLPFEKPFTAVGVFGHFVPCPFSLPSSEAGSTP